MITPRSILKFIVPFEMGRQLMEKRRLAEQTNVQFKLFKTFVQKNSIVFDVGANLGNRIDAILACGASVVAFDPQPSCIGALKKRYGGNLSVKIVPVAVGARPGRLPLSFSGENDTIASLSKNFISTMQKTGRFGENKVWEHTVEVEVRPLDELIRDYGLPSFIKIDVEGFEAEVLKGLSQAIDVISFEWTPDMSENALECVERCVSLGMPWFQISFGEHMRFAHKKSLSHPQVKDFIRMMSEETVEFGDIYASRLPLTRQ